MGFFRRRRRTLLLVGGSALVGGVALLRLGSRGAEDYRPGERTEGLTDHLRRDLPEDLPAVTFSDVAETAGLVFRHFPLQRSGALPEDMGSGVAVGDVDGDGWPDLFLVNAGPLAGAEEGWGKTDVRSRLFRNLGDGRFEDFTDAAGIELEAIGMGAALADLDSDADLDLVVTTYGGVHLWRNDGGGRFEEITGAAGLAGLGGFLTGIGVADYDRDGALDLYLCRYVVFDPTRGEERVPQFGLQIPARLNPSVFDPAPNVLLRGRGDGTFEDVTTAAGVADAQGRSLGVLFTDLDGDTWPDLYVANDVSDNVLLLNGGDGTFADRTSEALVGDYRGAMGLAAADFDGDRDLDLFITHWVAQENALYAQTPGQGGPLYFDVADRYGLGFAGLALVGWATGFFDYDNDGRLDLFVVNGSTIPEDGDPTRLVPMRSQLFWRSPAGGGHYHQVGELAGTFFGEKHVGRGGAMADLDLDGDEDLVVCLHGEGVRLLRNEGGNARPAVRVRLRQGAGNRLAIGARLEATIGGQRRLAAMDTQGSYLSQHVVGEVAFGLGSEGWIETLAVTWPDGARESAGPFPAGTRVTWTRGERPRIEALPGLAPRVAGGPAGVEAQRAFHGLRQRADRQRMAGEHEQAAASYLAALARWPGHEGCTYHLGNTLLALGREAQALAVFEALVAFHPGQGRGWMQLGRVRLPGGRPDLDDLGLARAAFEHCHDLNGEESEPLVRLGVVSLLEGDLDRASRFLADAARLNPRSVEARWLGGRAAYLAGDRSTARTLLAQARTLARGPGKGPGTSTSGEGDTATGEAMVARTPTAAGPLELWRTLAGREPDPDPALDLEREYGDG